MRRLSRRDPARRRLRNEVVSAALPLADRLGRRYRGRGVPVEDLVGVARLGLVKAADGFDAERGEAFSGFAVPTMLGEVRRYFRDKGALIRPPRGVQEARMAVKDASWELTQRLGRVPSVEDYARFLSMPASRVRAGLAASRMAWPSSLDASRRSDGEDDGLASTIGEEDPALERAELRAVLRPAMERLEPRERRILWLRFYGDLTQEEIGRRVNLSQMHVSRLLKRALRHLRRLLPDDARVTLR